MSDIHSQEFTCIQDNTTSVRTIEGFPLTCNYSTLISLKTFQKLIDYPVSFHIVPSLKECGKTPLKPWAHSVSYSESFPLSLPCPRMDLQMLHVSLKPFWFPQYWVILYNWFSPPFLGVISVTHLFNHQWPRLTCHIFGAVLLQFGCLLAELVFYSLLPCSWQYSDKSMCLVVKVRRLDSVCLIKVISY